MVAQLIVPVDGSHESWRAFDVALALARVCQGRIDIVEVVFDPADVPGAERVMHERIAETDAVDVEVTPNIELSSSDVSSTLTLLAGRSPGATFVIGSHGRGRSAALVGSVTDELLRSTFGPMIVVGPHADVPDFSGPILVTVDGSELSEAAIPLAAAWSIELGTDIWIVQVLDPDLVLPPDVAETVYTSRIARRTEALTNRQVNTEVLHGRHPADAVAAFAHSMNASLVVSATHGRTGTSRLTLGSTAAGFVKHLTCPMLLLRPPHFAKS